MPSPSKYNRGMRIPKKADVLDGWKVTSSRTEEHKLEKFRHYSFTTRVAAERTGEGASSLAAAVSRKVVKEATVYSDYGNPYICKTTIRGGSNRSSKTELVINGDCWRSQRGRARDRT